MAGTHWMADTLADIGKRGEWRSLDARVVEGRTGRTVHVGGREVVCLASNDYLGLAGDEVLVESARVALSRYGCGAGASRVMGGTTTVHRELERELASFCNAERALIFGSGSQAHLGIIPALVGHGDTVFLDQGSHANTHDGCSLSGARVLAYRHLDLAHLEELLHACRGGRRLVVTEAVFDLDGDVAPLTRLVQLATQHDAMTLVDEAHAVGTLHDGRGLCVSLGLESRVTVRTGSLGKALGSHGAFALGSRSVVDVLVHRAHTLVSAAALPPSACAAALAGLQEVRLGTRLERLDDLRRLAVEHMARVHLTHLLPERLRGIMALPTPILPVVLGRNSRAVAVQRCLEEAGYLTGLVLAPLVPEGTARLRVSLSAAHTEEDLAGLFSALARACAEPEPAPTPRPGMSA